MTAAAAVSASAYIVGHRHIPLIKFMGRRIVQKTEVRTVKGPTITKPVTSTTEGTFDPGRNRFPRLPLTAEEIECVQVSLT